MSDAIYTYKENQYKVMGNVKVKNHQTRKWEIHILYKNEIGEFFTRMHSEFFERFKLLITDYLDVHEWPSISDNQNIPTDELLLYPKWKLKIYSEGVNIEHTVLGGSDNLLIDSEAAAQYIIDFIKKRYPNCK